MSEENRKEETGMREMEMGEMGMEEMGMEEMGMEETGMEETGMELDLDKLEQVSGAGRLQDIISKIYRIGKAREYKEILRTEGKAAAAAACCHDIPELCGFCAAAVTMLH